MQPALVRKRHSNNSLFHPFFKKANHRNGGIFIVRLFDLLVKFIVKKCIFISVENVRFRFFFEARC
jgi:hypothetical protein